MTTFTLDVTTAERFLDPQTAAARREALREELGETGTIQVGLIGDGLYVVYAEGHGWIAP